MIKDLNKNKKKNKSEEAIQYELIEKIRDFELRKSKSGINEKTFPGSKEDEEYINIFKDNDGIINDDTIKERFINVIYTELSKYDSDLFKPNEIRNLVLEYGMKSPYAIIYPKDESMNDVIIKFHSIIILLKFGVITLRRRESFECHIPSSYFADILIEVFRKLNCEVKYVGKEK